MKEYKFKVDNDEKVLKLKPLDWDNFPRLFSIVSKLKSGEENIISGLDEKVFRDLRDLEVTMIKLSYPEMEDSVIKNIVHQNVFELLEPLIELNFKK
jgi:hypothetical protein